MIDMEHSPNELNDVLLQLQVRAPKLLNEEPENHGAFSNSFSVLKVQWPGYVDVSKLVTQINQRISCVLFHNLGVFLHQIHQASQYGHAEPVVRVPWAEPVVVKRVLDLGAQSPDARAALVE